MLSKNIQNALNEQINHELYSSYLYLYMSAHATEQTLNGIASWLRVQSGEETKHAMKLYEYVHADGGHIELKTIEAPRAKFKSPLDMFKQVLEHEVKVTGMITKLYELAVKERDYPTQIMLQWFITEQVEEENSSRLLVEKLEIVGESVPGLLYFDKDLGKRAAV